MFCPNCGKKIPRGTKFCPYCGTNLFISKNQTGGNYYSNFRVNKNWSNKIESFINYHKISSLIILIVIFLLIFIPILHNHSSDSGLNSFNKQANNYAWNISDSETSKPLKILCDGYNDEDYTDPDIIFTPSKKRCITISSDNKNRGMIKEIRKDPSVTDIEDSSYGYVFSMHEKNGEVVIKGVREAKGAGILTLTNFRKMKGQGGYKVHYKVTNGNRDGLHDNGSGTLYLTKDKPINTAA